MKRMGFNDFRNHKSILINIIDQALILFQSQQGQNQTEQKLRTHTLLWPNTIKYEESDYRQSLAMFGNMLPTKSYKNWFVFTIFYSHHQLQHVLFQLSLEEALEVHPVHTFLMKYLKKKRKSMCTRVIKLVVVLLLPACPMEMNTKLEVQ